MNKPIIMGVFLSLLGSMAFAEDATTYASLYQASIIDDERVNGDAAKAEAFTDCHMMALGAFPEAMQNEAFRVANASHNYDEARTAFSTLAANEMTASDERKAVIAAIIAKSKSLGDACLASI
ncbi:MAG: hypothetical protein K6L81_08175 [Agarilytica sp.]